MAQKGSGGVANAVETLVTPVLAQMGLRVWDVRFEKEGPDWFLRVFIDRDEPLDTDTCEAATRAINPVIDEADPIEQSYYLEVGSPGLGRRLVRDAHFAQMRGQTVLVHLYRAGADGEKDVRGVLLDKRDGVIYLRTDGADGEAAAKNAPAGTGNAHETGAPAAEIPANAAENTGAPAAEIPANAAEKTGAPAAEIPADAAENTGVPAAKTGAEPEFSGPGVRAIPAKDAAFCKLCDDEDLF